MARPDEVPEVPAAVAVLADALWRTMSSPDWAKALGDDLARTELLLVAICDALHPCGAVSVPRGATVLAALERPARNAEIRAAFRGDNHRELARRYGLSSRHIRRIVDL